MKIYLVASTVESWMNTGYGHGLLSGSMSSLLVSFTEFTKNPKQTLEVTTMAPTYSPAAKPERMDGAALPSFF